MAKEYKSGKLENGLFYTDSEILTMYNEAKDKREQLHVLAELNLCEEEDIKQALLRAGLDKCENGLSYTDSELLDMYNANKGDKAKYLSDLAEMNHCSDEDIKKALLRAGLDFRSLPRKRRVITSTPSAPVCESPIVVEPAPVIELQPVPEVVETVVVPNIPTESVVEMIPSQTKILELLQKATNTYQEVLTTKKQTLCDKIKELEIELASLRTELEDCEKELILSKSIFS